MQNKTKYLLIGTFVGIIAIAIVLFINFYQQSQANHQLMSEKKNAKKIKMKELNYIDTISKACSEGQPLPKTVYNKISKWTSSQEKINGSPDSIVFVDALNTDVDTLTSHLLDGDKSGYKTTKEMLRMDVKSLKKSLGDTVPTSAFDNECAQ